MEKKYTCMYCGEKTSNSNLVCDECEKTAKKLSREFSIINSLLNRLYGKEALNVFNKKIEKEKNITMITAEELKEKYINYRIENRCDKETALKNIGLPENIIGFIQSMDSVKLLIDILNDVKRDIEIDIYYDDYDFSLSATLIWDKDSKLSDFAINKYKDILYNEVTSFHNNPDFPNDKDYYELYLKSPDDEKEAIKRNSKLQSFLVCAAGYCDEQLYNKLFCENEYEKEDHFDKYDIELKYNHYLDDDFLGTNYDTIKKAYYDNVSKEEFDKIIDSLTL